MKGYEFEKGRYITITNEELEKIKTKKDKTIHVVQFAKMSDINMIHFEKNYYISPDKGAEKAFELLRQAMLRQEKVAVGKTVIGTTEQLIVLYPTDNSIIAKTLFYQEEIQEAPEVPAVKVEEAELEMAKMLISSMTREFDIAAYRDEYQARLREAIETKIKGMEIDNIDTSTPNNVIDLMEALIKSVELSKKGTA